MKLMLRLKEYVRVNRHLMEKELDTQPRRRLFSPAYYSQYQLTLPLLRKYSRGRLIDLGCGSMPYRQFLEAQVSSYDTLELFPTGMPVTYVSDVQEMPVIADEVYDTAICLEVLEHTPDPFSALCEIRRILKPGGVLIVSVPHLSRLHMEPHDYYRFTSHGLRRLLERAGLEISVLESRGGLLSFLGHQLATLSLGLVWRVPVLKQVVWFINSWLVTRLAYHADSLLDTTGVYAMGYTAVAVRHDQP